MTPSIREYLPEHADTLLKTAQGKGEKYLPWYAAAAGGLGGGQLASKVVPKKFKGVAQLAGTLLGTGAGVHGGEVAGKALDRLSAKTAGKDKEKAKAFLKTLGAGAAGMALGTAGGYGAGRLTELAARKAGKPLNPRTLATVGLPLAGAGLGTAYSLWKSREGQELRDASQGPQDS